MIDSVRSGSLAAVATLSLKETNQDACAVIASRTTPAIGVVICDGIGSHFGAEFASRFVAQSIVSQLEEMPGELISELDSRSMTQVYYNACRAVADKSREDPVARGALPSGASPGSTALCAVELQRTILLAYCGNGAIIHLRSNFNEFPKTSLLPWSAVNVLNPHSHPICGKNQLYKFLSATATLAEAEPSVLVLGKDDLVMGDIIAVVSDGIWSYDQTTIGQNDLGVWIHADSALPMLYKHLDEFFREGEVTQAALARTLGSYLETVKNSGQMSDDCSIGVLITGKALEYQSERPHNSSNEASNENDCSSLLAEYRV